MKTVLNTRDLVFISEYSSYNYNYYRHVDGRILFEQCDDDDNFMYWWTTEEDMTNHSHKNDVYVGACYCEDFTIPSQHARESGSADECEFEFESDWYC